MQISTKISLKSFKAQMKGYNLARDIASSSRENLILWVYFGGVESDMKQLETNVSHTLQKVAEDEKEPITETK